MTLCVLGLWGSCYTVASDSVGLPLSSEAVWSASGVQTDAIETCPCHRGASSQREGRWGLGRWSTMFQHLFLKDVCSFKSHSHNILYLNSQKYSIPYTKLRSGNPKSESKLVQPLWKIVWGSLKKLKIEVSYDLAIPLLAVYLNKMKSVSWRYLHPAVRCSIIHNSQHMEVAYVSICRWLVKKMWN